MLVQFNCLDKTPSMQTKRIQQLSAHLAWVEEHMANIRVAGPLKDDSLIIGSLYVLEADTIEQAEQILHRDPYYLADIWARSLPCSQYQKQVKARCPQRANEWDILCTGSPFLSP